MAYRNTIYPTREAPRAKTQRAAILRVLLDAKGAWVPLPQILALGIAQYNARILELRRHLGFVIENKTERVNGARHSWFRLVKSAAPSASRPTPESVPEWKDRRPVTGLPLWDAAVQR
jgi:hypothetical protein